ncbi:hypothetical protein [Cellulomonas wangsupingiae]|uniref:Glycosyltransferase RgtA/B/C/D-like domain-containing protein n=1 Tax=Cellulomonas wangsupingiae TaxID=2968085 RepID=A0ABY5K0H2_9CELL|nr:hypothetical protein [Cellulomonas wangsupingiae]MCC2335697.1 hypothetical protein [Cellulomonas wangsupingiae]UUI63932.1 hypothetical protein NP075_12405 [Cellulomonas wangsupingiae]
MVLLLVGGAARLALGARLDVVPGLGVTLGLGAAAVAVPVSIVFALGGDATHAVVGVLVVAAVAWLSSGLVTVRRERGTAALWRWVRRAVAATPLDALAAAVVLAATVPLLWHGLTYWTTFSNDFPSYAASVEVWAAGPQGGAAFLERHPDGFGEYQHWRAHTAKPMATALLLLASMVTGLPGAQLLAPATVVLLFLLVSTMLAVTAVVAPGRRWPVALATAAPLLSVVPLGRVYDAQLGQAAAAALLAVVLALLAGSGPPARPWVAASAVAVVLAAAVGMNPTLVVGSSVAVAGACVYVWGRRRRASRALDLRTVVLGVIGAVVLSLPFLGDYLGLGVAEADGTGGYELPFPSPAALVGLQRTVDDVTSPWAWTVVVLVVAGYVLYKRKHPGPWWAAVAAGAAAANLALLVHVYGLQSYSVHKYVALAVVVVVPLLLARAVGLLSAVTRLADAVAVVVALGAANAWVAATQVPVVVPDDLWALAGDRRVEQVPVLNVHVSNAYEAPVAATVLGNERIVVTQLTYAPSHPPVGDWALIHRDWWDLGPLDEVIDLNETYQLVRFGLTEVSEGERLVLDAAHPEHERLLYGRWNRSTRGELWGAGEQTWLAFALPDQLVGREVRLTLEGELDLEDGDRLRAEANGQPVDVTAPGSSGEGRIVVTVPADATRRDGDRLTVRLFPDRDGARIGVRVESLEVRGSSG